MSHIPYAQVPIIHQGLRQEETIVQITAALDYLEKVSSGIFQHIKSNVEKQKTQLGKLQDRSMTVKAKMDKLAGTNKATKVFASAKYPASDIPKDHLCDLLSAPLPPVERQVVKITSKHPPYEPERLKDKSQHFHVKSSKQLRKNVEVTPEEGLGSLPRDLDSVSALLLFNTSENLYKKYVMLDPLGIVTKTRQILEEEVKGDMDAAPQSMCQETVDMKGVENYFYSPTLQEVPQLDVPLDLPDLPGIADLQFSMDSEPPIAPSGSGSTNIPDLPTVFTEIPSGTVLPTPPPPPPAVITSVPAMQPTVTVQSPAPPPPPPPPPPEMPPPPPMQPPVAPPQPVVDVSTPSQTTNIPREGDARANLMEAIRKAGGKDKARLRSVIDRKQEAKRIKQEEEIIHKSSGGNLMADLHAKLSLRRKGISGAQPTTVDPLEKVLAMIPPPPMKESDTDEQDDADADADWED